MEKPRVRKRDEPDGSESRMAKKPEAEGMAEKPNVGEERSRKEPNGWAAIGIQKTKVNEPVAESQWLRRSHGRRSHDRLRLQRPAGSQEAKARDLRVRTRPPESA